MEGRQKHLESRRPPRGNVGIPAERGFTSERLARAGRSLVLQHDRAPAFRPDLDDAVPAEMMAAVGISEAHAA